MEGQLLNSLMPGDFSEHICVCVSRFWDFYDPQNEARLLHSNLVLIDEEGCAMHAQIYAPLDIQFKPLIKEGSVYNFSCFRVRKANNYKPVPNANMISFTRWTTIEEVVEIPPAFPLYTYSLTPLEQIRQRIDKNEHFLDVIGVVASVSSVSTLRTRARQTETSKRIVTIHDASGKTSSNVVLWGERATSFPGEQVCKEGQTSPQVVIFVGTLARNYADGPCLSAGTACRWYINPDVPEAKSLRASARNMHKPVKWDQLLASSGPTVAAETKKISDIKNLNPFMNKKREFLVTVKIGKIDKSWWYNACKKCLKTAKIHGDSYKCTEPECGLIGMPTQRFKLAITAGDETGDTEFILFGRIAQRLTKKISRYSHAENPRDFIPNEVTRLLERVFVWNVSFTENTIHSGIVCFQVNAVVGEIDDGKALLPMSPAGSQSSSLVLSQGTSSNMQGIPQKGAALALPLPLAASEASHASSTTPTKLLMQIADPPVTPQSGNAITTSEITPQKDENLNLHTVNAVSETISPPIALVRSPETPKNDDDTLAPKAAADFNATEDLGGWLYNQDTKEWYKKKDSLFPYQKKGKETLPR